ncbi:TlpA family protein disulfide reductase [Aestuariimicrobium soli]|uniref:TlpA family protein disulfide reductase n=1 Tax=Aestuariimicrobium soli TaxID=2035834 RepID=UPI003EB8D49E
MRGRRPGVRAAAVAVGLLLAAAGCSSAPGTTNELPTPTVGDHDPDLRAERKAAGIADCPRTMPNQPAVVDGLPPLTLPCLGGGSEVHLASLRGPLLVNFWAQWCGPCRDEGPLLAQAHHTFGSKVAFLGVDTSDPRPELAIEFAKQVGWTYPQVRDASGDEVEKPPLQAKNLPMTLLVAADGRIVARHLGGFATQAELDGFITTNLGVEP